MIQVFRWRHGGQGRLTTRFFLNITAPARPRVLLADDHIEFLESVSRLLAAAFDIVAIAGDGRQALDLARRLRPDVVVLDVSMPDLDGFQTLEQLRRDGLETRVVFLTMHQDDEFVAAAINAGAHGYVLKSRIHSDLISAIDHALAGRLFVPSLTSLSAVAGNRHTVQFHANDSHFLDEISQLVGCDTSVGRAGRHRHQRSDPHWRRSAPAGAADERRNAGRAGTVRRAGFRTGLVTRDARRET